MKRLSTGIEGLDRILGGGLIEGCCVLVEGAPGAGKTTLGLQFIYSGAKDDGERGLIVTFEESPEQIYRDASSIGWDLQSLEKEGLLRVLCISPEVFHDQVMEEEGLMDLLKSELDVKRIVIDSTTHFQQVTPHPYELRKLLFGLKNGLKRLHMTSMLLEEVESISGGYIPYSEYVVDVVLRLNYELTNGGRGRERTIEVVKSRGQAHLAGRHAFSLGEGGIRVYPRILPERHLEAPKEKGLQRIPTGIPGLDEMLTGGLVPGFNTLIAGSTGTGKTTLCLQFLAEGAARGERGLLVSFEERPDKIERLAATCGLDFAQAVDSGKIVMMHRPPAGLFVEEFLYELDRRVAEVRPNRIVVDSLTDIALVIEEAARLRETIWSLAAVLEPANATVMMTYEIPDVLGQFSITDQHLSVLMDGIILLRYVEIESEMQRAISVLKMRGTDHDKNIRRFNIGDRGLEVGPMFEGHEGIMGGAPHAREITMSLFSIDEADRKLNEEIISRYTRLNPWVRVEPLTVSFSADEARDTVMNILQSNSTEMGVVPVDVYWTPEMARLRMLQRLDHFFPASERKAFLDVAVRQCMVGDHIYAAPAFTDVGVLFYRKDLLEKYGFAPPKTWEELIHQSRRIIDGEGSGITGFIFKGHECEGLSCSLLEYIWSNGGDVAELTEETLSEALRLYRDLIYVHKIAPESVTERSARPEGYFEFMDGKSVFLRLWPHAMQALESEQSRVRGRVGMAPVPMGPRGSGQHGALGGWNLCIPAQAKSPSIAWGFIRYSIGYECQKLKAMRGGPPPTLACLYSDAEVLRAQPHYLELPGMLSAGRFRQDIPNYPAISRLLQSHAAAVLRREIEPERAAEKLAKEISAIQQSERFEH